MQIVTSDQARRNKVNNYLGTVNFAIYVGTPLEIHTGPQAYIVAPESGQATIDPHFHDIDQFQVFLSGEPVFGKKRLRPFAIHYADAFTPYGPIVAEGKPFSFLVVRAGASGGYYGMPAERDKMRGKNGQNITAFMDLGKTPDGDVSRQTLIAPRADGLKAEAIYLAPGATAQGVPSDAGGQFYLVCSGSAKMDGKELPSMSLLQVDAGEQAPTFTATAEGAEILVLQYAKPTERPGSDPNIRTLAQANYDLPPDQR